MKQIINLDDWNRKEIYEYYSSSDNPFVYLTTPINITKLYHFVKQHELPFYPTFGYLITKAMNKIDGFKYRIEDDNVVLYDLLNANFTDNINGERIYYFTVPFTKDFHLFLEDYKRIKDKYSKNEHTVIDYKNNEVWLSCAPWMKITGIITPYRKNNTIPQLIWDKFSFDNDNVSINLSIMAHHGFVDGFQIGKLINYINAEIENIEGMIDNDN